METRESSLEGAKAKCTLMAGKRGPEMPVAGFLLIQYQVCFAVKSAGSFRCSAECR